MEAFIRKKPNVEKDREQINISKDKVWKKSDAIF